MAPPNILEALLLAAERQHFCIGVEKKTQLFKSQFPGILHILPWVLCCLSDSNIITKSSGGPIP